MIYATVNKPLAAVLRATIGFPRVKVVGYRGTIGHLSRFDPASWLTYFHPGLDHVVTVSDATDIDGFLESIENREVDICGIEKSATKKVQMGSASTAKFVRHAPSTVHVQAEQALMSIKRGLHR